MIHYCTYFILVMKGDLAEKMNYGSQPSNVKYMLDEISNFLKKIEPAPKDILVIFVHNISDKYFKAYNRKTNNYYTI